MGMSVYKFRRKIQTRKFYEAIGGILETPPIRLQDAPWTIVSMVAKGDVPMYLLSIKSLYRALGRGKVVAIIDRDTPAGLRDTLRRHVEGIDFVILEDIPTGECQRGGTWERILHIVDRTESEYTIQIDSDVLTVDDHLDEVVHCCTNNIPFTMADGFFLQPMLDAARVADATPSDYIGIVTEQAFARYPGAEHLRYVRGSSGFAGFCRGGVTRADLTVFHKELEAIVGAKRFREWGTEQCASNFAVANSPNAVVLPYPDYASFGRPVPLEQVKLFHFIGAWRFQDGYFAARGREVIEKLARPKAPRSKVPRAASEAAAGASPVSRLRRFLQALAPSSIPAYLGWQVGGRKTDLRIALRSNVQLELRAGKLGADDADTAYEVFVEQCLLSRVWIPRARIERIVDVGAGVGFSCLFWANHFFSQTRIIAFEPDPKLAGRCRSHIAMNNLDGRIRLVDSALFDALKEFEGHRIDIMKIDVTRDEDNLLEDERFRALDISAIVMIWHETEGSQEKLRRAQDRLVESGFRLQPIRPSGTAKIQWAFRSTFPRMGRQG